MMEDKNKELTPLERSLTKLNIAEFLKIASPEDLEEIKALLKKKSIDIESNKRP
ncbi:hypothetical protein [Latilactobacillus curvatus]|uniref:hypothetical protein n=1 Tax=Latilactobacillus curvatus TaxID=28038 RepID=UPI0013C3720C|nr:hypothetical protein [Latilactobacillus curvatus]